MTRWALHPTGADGFFRIESVNFDQAAGTAVGSILGDRFHPRDPGTGDQYGWQYRQTSPPKR